MPEYLISRPGRPVHLGIFAYDSSSRDELYLTGHWVALCGTDRGKGGWAFTGAWAEKWEQHRRAGLCRFCGRKASELRDAARALRGES